MRDSDRKLTLQQIVPYQVTVPGVLDAHWTDWIEGLTITIEAAQGKPPITILTFEADQARLQGLLRRLYAVGLPLLSVICVTQDPEHPPPPAA